MYFFTAECIIPKLDLVFVLDTSLSIKDEQNFGTMKDFVKNTADLINISVNDSWASVMLFSDKASIRFPLTEYTDLEGFRNAVEDIKYEEVKRAGTNTPDALNLLRIASQNGTLGLRNDTVKLALVITDGRPHLRSLNISKRQAVTMTKNAAMKLHNSSIFDQIYSITIEGSKGALIKVLKYIAYPPGSQKAVPLSGFNARQFKQLTRNFTLTFCNSKLNYNNYYVVILANKCNYIYVHDKIASELIRHTVCKRPGVLIYYLYTYIYKCCVVCTTIFTTTTT